MGADRRHLHGPKHVWQRMGTADVAFTPGAFMQANLRAMDQALAAIQAAVPLRATIADLHAGVGALMRRQRCKMLDVCELCVSIALIAARCCNVFRVLISL